ncbi:hypothetical protein QUF64_06365 [Anaerolineales bacterium HSG6]|nr:hypothetical protein [Anaerolineales bacterium HSG6]MDM8530052.1 hypothetical protein [Anaerolineales bacterium HSG25]
MQFLIRLFETLLSEPNNSSTNSTIQPKQFSLQTRLILDPQQRLKLYKAIDLAG